jgi:HPt (histidine-containing phosphotransfer) domain-containing protein
MEPSKSILDLSFLRKFTEGDYHKMKHYMGLYLETAPGLFEELEIAHDKMDYIAMYTKSHSLKPLASYVGITGLSEILSEIEKAARENLSEEILNELIKRAIEINTRGMAELESYMKTKKAV